MARLGKKVSRKELLKDPEVVETLQERAMAWVQANQRTATIAATAVLVLIALVVGVRKYDAHKETQAMALYGQAQAVLGGEETPGAEEAAKALAAFKRVGDEYPNTAAARYAQLERANLLFETGKLKEAAALYEDCLKRLPRGEELGLLAKQGLAFCRMDTGDLEGARKLFEELAATGLAPGTAQLNLGLIYERQGKPAEALAAYKKAAEQARGPEGVLAKARCDALQSEGPEGGA